MAEDGEFRFLEPLSLDIVAQVSVEIWGMETGESPKPCGPATLAYQCHICLKQGGPVRTDASYGVCTLPHRNEHTTHTHTY